MPVVDLHVIEGYSSDEKRRLGESITDAIRFVIPAPSELVTVMIHCLLYTSPSPRDGLLSRMPSSA